MAVESSLQQYAETQSTEAFALQHSKLLKVALRDVTIQAKLGTMVAYQGEVKFEHAGSGGMARLVKKMTTGEDVKFMKCTGSGELFLAEQAQEIHVLKLEDDQITCNGANLLAFDAGIDWDITRVEGAGGVLTGGLFNVSLKGSGYVALLSDGPPLLLDISEAPTFADPNAAITWSSGVRTRLKTDINVKTLIGRGSGETFQVEFEGAGWVLVQPSEGRVSTGPLGGGGGGGGLLKSLGG
ncbi:MAG TPA: AIM24 family protein [Thermoleophilaceae bacterium]